MRKNVSLLFRELMKTDKVQGRRLRRAAMHKTHKSGERNGGSVYLGSCSGFCVYLQE